MATDRARGHGALPRVMGVVVAVVVALASTGCIRDHSGEVTVVTVERGPDGVPCRAAAALSDSLVPVDGRWDIAAVGARVRDLRRYLPEGTLWAAEVLVDGWSPSVPAVDVGVELSDQERAWAELDQWSQVMCDQPILTPLGGDVSATASRAQELLDSWQGA